MSVKVKTGVTFNVIAPAGYLILDALKAASRKLGQDLTITSGTDGVHSGPGDPHHLGNAYDVRSHDFAPDVKAQVLSTVMADLGWQHFYGFVEAPGTENEHYHFQVKRATPFSILDFLAFDPSITTTAPPLATT